MASDVRLFHEFIDLFGDHRGSDRSGMAATVTVADGDREAAVW
jgi:hypothetical protein